jgi:DNA-binding NarL/FixJ family response regulator
VRNVPGKQLMTKLRVYLIDDNTLFLVAASRFLTDFCAAEVVGVAQSAEDALQPILDLAPDVVLLDQNMPGASGLETAARIKAAEGAPAVIIVTLSSAEALRERALQIGCEGIVSKIEFTSEIPPLLLALDARRKEPRAGNEPPRRYA